jgi:LysR family hydrogen peroxide-inducible transcriptional activator
MELHQLRYFLAIIEAGSFSKAARLVNITQPSLSQQIAKLERELDHTLFDRLPGRVILTQAGEDLRTHASRILAEVRDAGRRVAERGAAVSGHLTVGLIPTLCPYILPALLKTYLRDWPQVSIEIVESPTEELVRGVERGEIDVALASSGSGGNAIHFEVIAHEELVLILPQDHPLMRKTPLRWHQLDQEDFVMLRDMHCLAGQVKRFCGMDRAHIRIAARACQLETIVTMAAAGLGVSVVPELLVRGGLPAGACWRAFAPPRPTREITAIINTERYQTRAVQEFLRLTRRLLGELFPAAPKSNNS